MALVPPQGPSTSMSREGSRTALAVQNIEQGDVSAQPDLAMGLAPTGTLRLRGGPRNLPHVAWDEDVVDNEGLGRKKSKICCIYHKPRRFDESSDEDSSGTESGSDGDAAAQPSRQYRRHRGHGHHVDGESEGGRHRDAEHKGRRDGDEHNAYERMSPRKGKDKAS